VTGLTPPEVTVASLDPLLAFEDVAAEGSGGADDDLATDMVASPVSPKGRGPQEDLGVITWLLPESRVQVSVRPPGTRSVPTEVIVASLDPSRGLIDVAPSHAPSQGLSTSVATTELVAPEVLLGDLDPLDTLEDDVLGAKNGSLQEAAGAAPAEVEIEVAHLTAGVVSDAPLVDVRPAVAAEVEVAHLTAGVVSDAPLVDARPAVAVTGGLPLVEVSNGTGRLDMAARIRDYLKEKGIAVKRLTNAENFRHQETVIFYRSGWRAYAEDLARMLPAVIDLDRRPGQESDVRLELGGDLLEFDGGLYYAVKRSNDANRG
jgi:hypothetical protein